ncbi:MAG: hypothetical protein MK008_01925 [Bdellovibrionales bacterium]|nr:hypothetical protein [Bdellovibrionales bacterium]
MKKIGLLLPALVLLSACGGGRNYLALSGNRCPAEFNVQVVDQDKADQTVPFDLNQLPVGSYDYVESQIYYKEIAETDPTMISVSEVAVKTTDRKTGEENLSYSEAINCARNLKQGQDIAFSYTLTTDFSIAESSQESPQKLTRTGEITTRVANVLISANTKGAITPNFTAASQKEASDKLTKYIPQQTELRLYQNENSYELRTKTVLPDAEVISVIKYNYRAPGE